MSDTIMETKNLPIFIEQKFGAMSVKISEQTDSLVLRPMLNNEKKYSCPFLGLLSNQEGMVEEQIAKRRASERG